MAEFKVGDIVRGKKTSGLDPSILYEVLCVFGNRLWLKYYKTESVFGTVLPEAFEVYVEPLKVGDKARWRESTYEIVGLNGERAWCKLEGAVHAGWIHPISELTKAP